MPSFLRKYGIHFTIAGFAAIVWIEQTTRMTASPLATSFLLLSILAAATITGLLFERRAWCRYLCPLGGMASVFAATSVIEFRGNLVAFSLLAFGILWTGGIIAIRRSGQLLHKFRWLALAFIPLAFAGELGHQLTRLLLWTGQFIPTLGRQIGFDYLQKFGIQVTPVIVHGSQFIVILFGAITTLVARR